MAKRDKEVQTKDKLSNITCSLGGVFTGYFCSLKLKYVRTSHISAVLLLCGMFRRDFTSCCGSSNRSSWTAGVTSGVGRDGAQEDDPSSQLTLAAEI